MTPQYRDERVAVYDNFLSELEQQKILEYFEKAEFRRVLPDGWGSAYRLSNGEPLVGREATSEASGLEDGRLIYPTTTAMDILFRKLRDSDAEIASIAGSQGDAWTVITMCPYVYPAASGLAWHMDPHCAGAYIYYAHRTWGIHWGGELLVEYCERDCAPAIGLRRGILPNEALASSLKRGMGYYFVPAPNRLVLLRGGTPHMIKAVEYAAGENLRLSLSGFFMQTQGNGSQKVQSRIDR